jgi:AcrR family transcriptional regulator
MTKSAKILSLIVELLKQDSRTSILEMSRQIGVPKSTVYDYYRKLRERYWFTVVERADELSDSSASAKQVSSFHSLTGLQLRRKPLNSSSATLN